MDYALDLRTFLFSHYFYTGLRIATGVIGLTLLVFNVADLPITMTVFLGALCTSLMDLPSPLRHKFNEMLAGVLLCTSVMLVISLCAPFHAVLSVMMVVVAFLASMMVVYGKKTMPLQFASLMVMTLSMENNYALSDALMHCGLFFCGGIGYLTYSMVVSWFLRRRIKQQILAESLFELARYLRIKADFYDVRTDINAQFSKLVRHQIVLADKQQAARDLILRDLYTKQDGLLVQVHLSTLELYEQILSTHADYALLRSYFASSDVMVFLRDLANKTAQDIESIAYAITRKRASTPTVNYKAELRAIQYELQQLQQDALAGHIPEEAITLLRLTYNKIRDIIEFIGQLHLATQKPVDPLPILPGSDMTPFLTQQKYKAGLLIAQLHWNSPVFRFAIRVALAVSTGLWIADHLPYVSHGYWIVLTIVIILKPNFSNTKQRLADRLIGTIIGCIITAIVLRFVHQPAGLLAVLFVASVAAPAFTYIKYRYTAIAASVQILLLLNMILPAGHTSVVGERLIDTIIGVVLALLFSRVLPSWEYRGLPRLITNVLKASQRYISASRDMMEDKVRDDFFYRVCRKGFMDSLAALISALVRMTDEPVSKQRAVAEINRFVVQNYLVAAHIAALRIMLRRHAEGLPREYVNQLLETTYGKASDTLTSAQTILAALTDAPGAVTENAPAAVSPAVVVKAATEAAATTPATVAATEHAVAQAELADVTTTSTVDAVPVDLATAPLTSDNPAINAWSGWPVLQRRATLLNQDLLLILKQTSAIGQQLKP